MFPLRLSQIEYMDIAHLIQTYGYFAVALGSFLEGAAVLLAGSLAAYQGHLSLPLRHAYRRIAGLRDAQDVRVALPVPGFYRRHRVVSVYLRGRLWCRRALSAIA